MKRAIERALQGGLCALLAIGSFGRTGRAQVGPGSTGVPAAAPSGASPTQTKVPQAANSEPSPKEPEQTQPDPSLPPLPNNLYQFAGKQVTAIRYDGVDFSKTDRLMAELTQKAGTLLVVDHVRETTRRLFATGRYRNIAVRVEPSGDGVVLIFSGIARFYVGRVQIVGVKEARLTSLLEYGTKLNPGAPFTPFEATSAIDLLKAVLAQNGYYEPVIAVKTERDLAGQQVNITYTVAIGPQARVGNVNLSGNDPGISVALFRKKAKSLKPRSRVARETSSTALDNLRSYFQSRDRLEATVLLRKSTYDAATKTLNYDFNVEQGPIVKIVVEGAKFSKNRLHLLVPIFQEGTVDIDLLNEATFNIKDYLQQQGYFDATVTYKVTPAPDGQVAPPAVLQSRDATKPTRDPRQTPPGAALPTDSGVIAQAPPAPESNPRNAPITSQQTVSFLVDRREGHRVEAVEIQGNKYFATDLLRAGLKVQKADAYDRSGRYSQQLVKGDESNLQSIYRANGFKDAKITHVISDVDNAPDGKPYKLARIAVTYKIEEGDQQRFGDVSLSGVSEAQEAVLKPFLQATSGQPFSLLTLSGDRDVILSFLLSNGYDQARVEVSQTSDDHDKTRTDVQYQVTPGKEVFVGKVLESGLHYTKPKTVDQQLRVHAGDPLDQGALLESQRNLYNLALFNEVDAAVQNPSGDAEQKNVVIQLYEGRRWDVTYGFGFEAQTGLPACRYCTQQGTTAAQQGRAGVSPRVSLDVTRINLAGTDNSLTVHTAYGLLETVATATFQSPHLFGNPRFAGQLSGGYANVQDITTFASSKLEGDFKVTHKATRKDTFIYDFEFRRVAVNPNSLAISASLIPQLSQPVRVGGPGITWFHDTRVPSPLDAEKGSYTSVQEFLAYSIFGSQTDFNRTDLSNSTYYPFGKKNYVFARNTRVGFIASFGPNINASLPACTQLPGQDLLNNNASCNPVPLPERLYAGGSTSHRGFGINSAGPRDLQTGYPVGGSAVFLNQFELRLPPPVLPFVGDNVSFVVFHDMGNVFQHAGDMFPSIGRFKQPDEQTCENVTPAPNANNLVIGTCNFNYFSHAVGLGARYKTPVGPIRVDFSYNLNPPKYPQICNQTTPGVCVTNDQPTFGQAPHFNFFFSIGQTF